MSAIEKLMAMQGRAALITGAAGGLGTVFSRTLAEMGADLLLVDRAESGLVEMAARLAANHGVKARALVFDLEQEAERGRLMGQVRAAVPALYVLINNAAFVGTSDLQGWGVPFEQQTVETWRRALEVNLTAAFDLCKGLAPHLRKAPGASIINIGSIYGELGPRWDLYEGTTMSNPAAYGASKAGLGQLTRWLATTLAPDVRVNMIAPGGVFRGQPEAFVRRYEDATPLQRMASEEDFAGIIAYLASDMSRYVTGQTILVDGGWSVW
ncbi:MAG TPA: SDR family oxidoreductase [Rhizomicrobium sp.]|nr:SDR family oxidoreductase [Rhizomicrobium sp.]